MKTKKEELELLNTVKLRLCSFRPPMVFFEGKTQMNRIEIPSFLWHKIFKTEEYQKSKKS